MAAVNAGPLDVSVVIPTFNGGDLIEQQISSVLGQQTTQRFEIVVADNGSTDRTTSVVHRLMQQHEQLRLVDASAIRGSSHARNVGVRAAAGPVVAMCDADDLVEAGWLDALVGATSPGVIATGPLVVDQINDEDVVGWRPPRGGSARAAAFGFLPFAPSGNMAIMRDDFLRLGGFREDYPKSHDVEFSWRAQLAGMEIVHIDAARLHYRYRATVRGVFRQAVRSGRASAQLFADFRQHGLARSSVRAALRNWVWLVVRAPLVTNRASRGVWIRRLGEAVGRLLGSFRYRVWYP